MELSELDYLILAMVSQGVVSGYAMKKVMEGMRGGRWSADSGSVYRVIRRHVDRGWLKEAGKNGCPNRERTEYDITDEGLRLVLDWLRRPPPREELGYQVDTLRTRAYFLDRLSPPERLDTVRRWLREAKAYRVEVAAFLGSAPVTSEVVRLAMSNLTDMADARITWLRRLEAHLKADLRAVSAGAVSTGAVTEKS